MSQFIPSVIPTVYDTVTGSASVVDVNTGGYDVSVGGHGFRLATDQQFYYSRATEPTTVRRFDNSLEPGEQSLSPLPWIKSQSSFHAGAGQLNLEQGFTAFQYQAEQVEHIRFDTCLGVDVWTPGEVSRLNSTYVYSTGGEDYSHVVTGISGSNDCAVAGGAATLASVVWASGPDAAPTLTDIDLTGADFGGKTNCSIASVVTDGANYYALIHLTVVGALAGVNTLIVSGQLGSTTAPSVLYKAAGTVAGSLGWVKARLVAGLGPSLYELSTAPASPPVDVSTLTPKYTHPALGWLWDCFSDSPAAILAAGHAGRQSNILAFTLDSSGAFPTLSGGNSVAVLPPSELIYSLGSAAGSFLVVGTSQGVRIGTFDTYTGALSLGPLSVNSTSPVLGVTNRDRFIFAGWTNQQADGKTGLVRIDLSMTVDAAGRLAYAPDLRPPYNAPTGLGTVKSVNLLPLSNRLLFVANDGVHVEASAPNASDPAWLQTSRIRYDTAEMKLFKLGRVHGTLATADIQVTGITPYAPDQNLGTFGFVVDQDPNEFALPPGLWEWIQLKFSLIGSTCVMNSYQVKAFPAPAVQDVIMFTVNCFLNEVDKFGLDVTDPELPRQRWQNVVDLKNAGNEIRYVEFTNQGAVAELVLIDQIEFRSYSRPTINDDFGGYITMKLRKTTA